ncbi:MAG TPA: c-type cytochrome domain-containing protein [Burkholderiales bacterium]|nr:c-type cytochrome domain-containing protein [Burkholderiales bacterium]
MNAGFIAVSRGSLAALAVLSLAACAPSGVSYKKDVQPILTKYCAECHTPGGKGFVASGLDVTSYATLMKGTKFGKVVKPGDALTSTLNMLVEGRANAAIRMPHGRAKLPDKDIATLKAWVNEGAKDN